MLTCPAVRSVFLVEETLELNMRSSPFRSDWEGHGQHREEQGGSPEMGVEGHNGQWSGIVTACKLGYSGVGKREDRSTGVTNSLKLC